MFKLSSFNTCLLWFNVNFLHRQLRLFLGSCITIFISIISPLFSWTFCSNWMKNKKGSNFEILPFWPLLCQNSNGYIVMLYIFRIVIAYTIIIMIMIIIYNIVISWHSVFLVEETGRSGENHDLSQVTDKLYHIMLYATPWSRFELTTLNFACINFNRFTFIERAEESGELW
jgi:hypothetical protein